MTDMALEYKKAKLTILIILKKKDAIKGANVTKGVMILIKQRTQVPKRWRNICYVVK